MYSYYLIACIPVIIGAIITKFSKKINYKEFLIGTVIAFITAGILHLITIQGMTSDTEILSGKVVSATWYPEYVETYQEAIYRTYHTGYGKHRHSHTGFDHYETRYRTHYAHGEASSYYGGGKELDTYSIERYKYDEIAKLFGSIVYERPIKRGFYSGDPLIYTVSNTNNVTIPTILEKTWCNKVKACPSSFSFHNVDDSVPVFPYPSVNDKWKSNRLLGDANGKINIREFDRMNTRIGLTKKANVVIVGFKSADKNLGYQQRDKWYGGKKSDIVICYGYAPLEENKSVVVWTYAFSWTTNEKMLRSLEEIFQDYDVNNNILPLIEKEVMSGYVRKDWTSIDLMTIEPSAGWYWFFCIFMVVTQVGLYLFFHFNEFDDYEY